MEKDLISVLMTVYKESEEELRQSFESIINQTYKNLEIIIVIDNPEEKWREELIKEYKDARVNVLVNNKNIGLPLSLNKALNYAKGKYIARMDADDISILDRFEKQIAYLKEHDYDMVGSYMQYFFNNQNQQLDKYPSKPENINKLLKYKSCVLHPTWLAKSKVFFDLDGYRNIFACEDYDFLMRATLKGFRIANYPEVLYKCRLSTNSISRTNSGRQEITAEILRKNFRKNKITSIEKIESYINSKNYKKKIKKYNHYCRMKDKRARFRVNKFPMFYIYTLMLFLNIKLSYIDIRKNIYNKYILYIDKKQSR